MDNAQSLTRPKPKSLSCLNPNPLTCTRLASSSMPVGGLFTRCHVAAYVYRCTKWSR